MDQFVHKEDSYSRRSGMVKILLVFIVLLGLAAVWRWTPLSQWLDMEGMAIWATSLKENSFAIIPVVCAFVLGGLIMVPVTILVGTTALIFDPLIAAFYAMAGCFLNSLVTYLLGCRLGRDTIRHLAGRKLNRLSKRLADRGILTIVVVRNLPVAPFTIVNLVAGAFRIKLSDYLLGTIIGMSPGILAITIFTDRLLYAVTNPKWSNILIVMAVAVALGSGISWINRRISREGKN
jgi:uncharacterized membrane protein YdjX (TVP38/TMEM64 family)